MILFLWACKPEAIPADPPTCDPRVLEPGEVRARRIPCSDELIVGGEARVGDWLLENAVARYTVRGPYADLTELGQDGGTLLDAAVPGGTDLLLELIPEGDRSSITMEAEEGAVTLTLPGVSYRLEADSPLLQVSAGQATLQERPGVERVGATLRGGDNFFGADGTVTDGGGRAFLTDLTRVSVDRDALYVGTPQEGEADADTVLVRENGQPLERLPVEDGHWKAMLPEDVELLGEREGCQYEGLQMQGCGSLTLRLVDGNGEDVSGQIGDGTDVWRIPLGGGRIPVGPVARMLEVWAGPAWSQASYSFPGGDVKTTITLQREISAEHRALAVLDRVAAPDASTDVDPWTLLRKMGGEGVDYAVVLADDEVPGPPSRLQDSPWAEAGSRTEGMVWSWPWAPTYKKAAHGAVDGRSLDALDLLAVSAGRAATDHRLTVVTPDWVEKALAEAPAQSWSPRPDAVYLRSLSDLPDFIGLLNQWIDVAPVGPYTWLTVDTVPNLPTFERAFYTRQTVAGNGPALSVQVSPAPEDRQFRVVVTVEAPLWMGSQKITLETTEGSEEGTPDPDGRVAFEVPVGTAWLLATTRGQFTANPWLQGESWAVSAPVWLR